MTSCRAFDAWLDDGMPEPAGTARAHAAACARCARALAAALALERALGHERARAPRGFTEVVMARVAREAEDALTAAGLAPPGLPWWLRAAAHPASVLAFALAAIVQANHRAMAGWADAARVAVVEAVAGVVSVAGRWLVTLGAPAAGLAEPSTRLAFALGLAPLVLLLSLVLYRWSAASLGPVPARAPTR